MRHPDLPCDSGVEPSGRGQAKIAEPIAKVFPSMRPHRYLGPLVPAVPNAPRESPPLFGEGRQAKWLACPPTPTLPHLWGGGREGGRRIGALRCTPLHSRPR